MYSSLTDLKPGERVRVIKSFKDFDGTDIIEGTEWSFVEYNYFPYDEGYTFVFTEGIIRLAGIDSENDRVLSNAAEFFTLAV